MSTSSSVQSIFGRVDSLASSLFSMMQTGISAQAQRHLLNQLLGQIGLALHSNLGKEAIAELESRLRVLLYHFSGRGQLTVMLAEFLRSQIQELEVGARRLNEIADADHSHSAYDVGYSVHSHDRLAAAIRHEAKALSTIARHIESLCLPLRSIIPSDLDTYISTWGLSAERILAETPSAGLDVAVIAPAQVGAVADATVDAAPAAQTVNGHAVYTFGADKERALRRRVHALADDLNASLRGLRRMLDDAQHPGLYDIAALHAVTSGLAEDVSTLAQRLEGVIDETYATVRFG